MRPHVLIGSEQPVASPTYIRYVGIHLSHCLTNSAVGVYQQETKLEVGKVRVSP